jgi:small-conductance mechanosensitive channel
MRRLALLAPLLASVGLAALGGYVMRTGPDPATTPVPVEFQHPPTPIAAPPLGARPNAWVLDALHEGRRDGVLLVLASIVFVTTLVHLVAPESRMRVRTSVLFFFGYLVTLPACGLLAAGVQLEAYGWLRTLAVFCIAVTITNLVVILLFDVVLPTIRLTSRPILRDLLTGIAYIVIVVSVLSRAGVELKGILAGSAVLGAIVGLSIQSTLGDAFGGLILEWEDSIEVGDWIRVGDVTGKVMEIRWRYLRLETRNWETVIIPNSAVTKAQVMILGRRQGQPLQWRRWVYFNVDFKHPPTEVIGLVNATLQAGRIERVSAEPKAHCILIDIKDTYASYAVRYWLTEIATDDPTDSVVRTRICLALQRAGIEPAVQNRAVRMAVDDEASRARIEKTERESRSAALRRFDLFRMLTPDEESKLVPHLHHALFAKGEVMTRQGAEANWLYLLCRGSASVQLETPDGELKHIARLQAPDYFGEIALLTGEKRTASVMADSECECWRLERAVFKEVVQARPEIATELSTILAKRRHGLEQALSEDGAQRSLAEEKAAILRQITRFFGLTE